MVGHRVAPYLLIAVVVLLAAGCSSPPPVEHVRGFSTATADMRNAGNLLYDKLNAVLPRVTPTAAASTNDRACADAARVGVPCQFDPGSVGTAMIGSSDRPEVAVRRLALDLVAAYGSALAELAEGGSAPRLQAEVNAVVTIASSILTLTGAAAPAGIALAALRPQIGELAASLENARTQAELRRAILANRERVGAVLSLLIEDTRTAYRVYLDARLLRRLDQATNAREYNQLRTAARDDINGFNASLAAYVLTLRAAGQAYERLAQAVEEGGQPSAAKLAATLDTTARYGARATEFWETVRRAPTR
jgi:hypothetical protein